MKPISLLVVTGVWISSFVNGQQSKKSLPLKVSQWESVSRPIISNDGKTVAFFQSDSEIKAVLKRIGDWEMRFKADITQMLFTDDSKKVILGMPGDSICILDLTTKTNHYLSHVSKFKLLHDSAQSLIAYQSSGSNVLSLFDLSSGMTKKIASVSTFFYSPESNTLVLFKKVDTLKKETVEIVLFDFKSQTDKRIWTGTDPQVIIFDNTGKQLVFLSGTNKEKPVLYYYDLKDQFASILVNDFSPGMSKEFKLINGWPQPQFSKDGGKVYFNIKNDSYKDNIPLPNNVLKIWNYQQQGQLPGLRNTDDISFTAVVDVLTKRVVKLTNTSSYNYSDHVLLKKGENFVVTGEGEKSVYNGVSQYITLSVISLIDQHKTVIKKHLLANDIILLSPDEQHVVYFDRADGQYYAYNIQSGLCLSITDRIHSSLYTDVLEYPINSTQSYGIGGWFGNKLLVYDEYDIWQVDLNRYEEPVNLTRKVGRKTGTVFRVAILDNSNEDVDIVDIHKLLLTGFNKTTKYNGFYSFQDGHSSNVIELTSGPYIYQLPLCNTSFEVRGFERPARAKYETAFVVKRMSPTNAPNYFFTKDFTTFTPVSDVSPHKKYNWYSTKLIRWKMFDGRFSDGILYLPEDFDPNKKYPVIFYFYEKFSDGLYEFINPGLTGGVLDIPFYVSNGYLVFVPDIHFETGHICNSVYNSVVSAAKHLTNFRYVDSSKMGLQGHSLGGFEVNCIISRTHLFAAAASASGASNMVSNYLTADAGILMSEIAAYRLGTTLWKDPEIFIKNSPVFNADKIRTPLLLEAGGRDKRVPFSEGKQLFNALRRLNQKVWLLEYPDSEHSLGGYEDDDYNRRLFHFFNYFLKGDNKPIWMKTVGNTGFELSD